MATSRKAFKDFLYHYTGTVLEIIDGDSMIIDFDFGCNHSWNTKEVRFARYNSAELHSKDPVEAQKAKDALAFLQSIVPVGAIVMLKTNHDATEKYARLLAEVWVQPGDKSINQQMIDSGHGKPYDGKGPKPV